MWTFTYKADVDSTISVRYSKTCVKRPLSKDHELVFKTTYRLMQVKSIAEYSMVNLQKVSKPFYLKLKLHVFQKTLFKYFNIL